MFQAICKLCLFKSEPTDEFPIEESAQLRGMIQDIFHGTIVLTKLELDTICTVCREKLKSFHEYYKFVLVNQESYMKKLKAIPEISEFIEVVKQERPQTPDVLHPEMKVEVSMDQETERVRVKRSQKKRRSQRPRSQVVAVQKQQSDLILLLFDLTCTECLRKPKFPLYRKLINHYRFTHKKTKTWTCCETVMTRDIELIEHIMEHQGDWKCTICNLPFSTSVDLWTHNNTKHSEPSAIPYENPKDWLKLQHECDLCGEKFRTRGLIGQHMKELHIKNSVCDICGDTFYNNSLRAKHRKQEHATVLKIPCAICGVMITNKPSRMEAHIKNSHVSQSMICPTCGKVCKNDVSIRMHMIREHKPPKHKCSFCEKSFKTTNHLKDHEATHTGIARYFCNVCGAQFKSTGNYMAHRRRLHPLEHMKQKLERRAKRFET